MSIFNVHIYTRVDNREIDNHQKSGVSLDYPLPEKDSEAISLLPDDSKQVFFAMLNHFV